MEHRTGRGYVHGELVSLGVLLMSRLQGNEPARVERILNTTGVRYQPRDLNMSLAEVKAALLTLPAYVEREKLPFSVINARTLDSASVRDICRERISCHWPGSGNPGRAG